LEQNPRRSWDIVKPGAKRASGTERRQRDFDKRAGEILRNAGDGERITKGTDGKSPRMPRR
jgi:hypothetical protein